MARSSSSPAPSGFKKALQGLAKTFERAKTQCLDPSPPQSTVQLPQPFTVRLGEFRAHRSAHRIQFQHFASLRILERQQTRRRQFTLARIVQMLVGLLKRFSERADLLREDEAEYGAEHNYDHEQKHEEE